MRTAPANWNTYLANVNHVMQYRLTISDADGSNPEVCGVDTLKSLGMSTALLTGDVWIGNVVAKKISVDLLASVTVPRMARLVLDVRVGLNGSYTDYVTLGTFWVDERATGSVWTALTAYDATLKMDQTFIDAELEAGEWPITMAAAVTEICTRIGLTLDARTTIQTGADYVVAYTNDLTMREMLGYIGVTHGGNWTVTADNKLRLIPFASPAVTPDITVGAGAKTSNVLGGLYTISKVILTDAAGNSFAAGDDTGHVLDLDCPYATQTIADALCAVGTGSMYGMTYQPYEATGVRMNPIVELWDTVSAGSVTSVIATLDAVMTTRFITAITAPSVEDIDHEYPYLGEVKRMQQRSLQLGASYFGTTISRKNGLQIAKSDGNSLVTLNSDMLKWQVKVLGEMIDRLYFDAAAGDLKYNGKFGVEAIEALKAEIDVVVSNTVIVNNLTAQKGYIARLTVDSIDSSDMVQNYLASDKSTIGYFRGANQYIQFIEAMYVGDLEGVPLTEQATDNGNPLYWIDAENIGTGITTDVTDYPIMQYQYTELVKTEIFHRLDTETGHYNPVIRQGAGNGVGKNGTIEMEKKADGWYATYVATGSGTLAAGEEVICGLTDSGTLLSPFKLEAISFSSTGFSVTYSGETMVWTWTKDGAGKITSLTNEDGAVPVTWG